MNNTLTFKNYSTDVEFDSHDRIFFGRIAGIRDVVTFHGKSVDELRAAFEEAVDDYLETCEKLGQKPDEPHRQATIPEPGDSEDTSENHVDWRSKMTVKPEILVSHEELIQPMEDIWEKYY